jgi:phospholipase C
VALHQITLETTGTPAAGTDLQHDHAAFELEYDGGKMDGFDLITFGTAGGGSPARLYPYAYVERSESKPYWDMARQYALGDRMFSTATTDSFVAHQQIIAGTAQLNANQSLVDTPTGIPWGCDAPSGERTAIILTSGRVLPSAGPFPCFTQYGTMADVLDAANVSWKYYVYNDPFVTPVNSDFSGGVWNGFDAIAKVRCAKFTPPENCSGYGADWKAHVSFPSTNVLSDIKNGTLPQMSWVIPALLCSDHPAAGANLGPSWVAEVVNAVGASKYWNDTAIIILWDDWGGFYDNVAPPQTSYTSLGMRVPLIVVSRYAKHGFVSHTQYDFGSVLKFVEETFGTGSLGTSDTAANSISDAFDFAQTPPAFTPIAAPQKSPRCAANVRASNIIEHDGGVPE